MALGNNSFPERESKKPIYLALLAIGLCFVAWFVTHIGRGSVISWDGFGYYFYLPMILIEHTVLLESLDYPRAVWELYDPSSTLYQFTTLEGRFIIRYPAGMALVYTPFFLIGHLVASFTSHPADGFSEPYEYAMRVGSMVYHFMAFVLIARLLSVFFRPRVVALTLLLLFFATNAFYHLLSAGLSANGTLFFLLPAFMLAVHRYFEKPNMQRAVLAGLLLGVMGLSRPTELLAIVPAMLWPAATLGLSWKAALRHSFSQPVKHLVALALSAGAVGSLQLMYWKVAGGSWIINSYGNPAEGLDWWKPYTWSYLFSFKKGWFIYTPFMLPVVVAMLVYWYRGDRRLLPVAVYTIIFVYLASSWTNWWYGGGWAQRSIIQAYALLSLPLAVMVERAGTTTSQWRRMAFWTFAAVSIALNFWQSYQYRNGVRLSETETAAYYAASFFDRSFDPEKYHLTAVDRFSAREDLMRTPPEGYTLYATHPFHEAHFPHDFAGSEFMKDFKIPYRHICPGDHCWVVLEATFDRPPPEGLKMVSSMQRSEGSYTYRAYEAAEFVTDTDTLAGTWTARTFYLTPHVRSGSDRVHAYLWNMQQQPVQVLGLRVHVYVKEWPRR